MKNIHNKIAGLVVSALLLSVAISLESFYTLSASAALDSSNSSQMEFHGVAIHQVPTSTLPQFLTNVTLTQSSSKVITMPIWNKTSHTSALLSNNSLANLGTVTGQTLGNDGYCRGGNGCGLLTYHGGKVMHNARLLIVFWVGGSFSDCSTSHYFENSINDPTARNPNDCSYMNLQTQFLQDVCGDPFMKISSQYGDDIGGAGPCFIGTPAAGKFNPVVDTSPFPEIILTDADIQNEAINVANYEGGTFDGNTMVFVFTPYNTPSCLDSGHTSCFGSTYCGYHTSLNSNLPYANMPDAAAAGNGCSSGSSPNIDPVSDDEINVLSHELTESLTNPSGGGWYYINVNHEIADECTGDISPNNVDSGNIHLGKYGDSYIIQKEWSNSNGGCTLGEQSLPAAPSAPPTGITASPISSNSIRISWTASASATSYNILRSTSAGGTAITLVGSPVTTSFTDTGLASNATYYYKLTASNTGGTSARSNIPVSATTFTVPGASTGLVSTAGNTQVSLSWTAPASNGGSPITDYVVEYRTGANSFVIFADGISTFTSATVTGLTNGISYDFRVSAVNSVGSGLASAIASAAPTSCSPPLSGDWIISSSCTLGSTTTAPANVIVQNNSILTIPNGIRLNIDFTHYHLLVKSGSGVLIKAGGAIN